MKVFSRALALSALLSASCVCALAGQITTWTLNNVTFDNGNVLNGWFTTDLSVPQYDTFSITVTGPATNAAFTAAIMVNSYLPNVIGIANAGFSEYVDLYLSAPLTNAGGVVPITSGFDCPNSGHCGVLVVNSGLHPDVISPEPSSLFLLVGGGLIIVGLNRRRD